MGAYYFYHLNPPNADFTADTTNGYFPLTVNFTDLSTQGSGIIDEWYWEFGDGNNSSLQDPANEYQLPGIYTVSLTVIDVNDSTETETKEDYITVYPSVYSGPIWHISTTGSDIWGNGSTQYPFATIQHGINTSSNTDTVLVQPGTYVENINFNGKLITVASLFFTTQDTSYISNTIIDGNQNGSVITFINAESLNSILNGFSLTNGTSTYDDPDSNSVYFHYGGGIYCKNSNPSLFNLIIHDNMLNATSGIYCGGGIACYNSSPSIINVTIKNNKAYAGAGIFCGYYSSPNVLDVRILENTCIDLGAGGGIYCIDISNPILSYVLICNNTSGYSGGGIYCNNASPTFINITVTENITTQQGGGICCRPFSNPMVFNGIFWNNYPHEIYINESASLTITYSDIQGGWTGTDNIDTDPLFVNPGVGDYHLQSESPCIDAGDPASPLDPDGTIADMGAYYFHQHFGPVWHISTTGSDLTGNGSEQFPFATIQHGINCSADTDTVLVQPGTYVENIDFSGKLITVGSLFLTTQDTTYVSSTTIDGNSSGSVVTFENSENSTTVLCGFTITNGSATSGGGIYCQSYSNPSLQNVTISGNSADLWGGGIYCWESSPSLENLTITGNTANYGGGIYCYYDSSPGLENVTISGNSATTNGGGIFCYFSSPILINSILWDDSPQEIYTFSSSVAATYSDIEGGWAGTGNINADPLFMDPGLGDYHLQPTSPCIDAGDPASPLDPDGTIADMGAYYFHQTIAPDPPQNVIIEIIGTDVHLSWDAVAGANSYKVYSSDDPYTGFVEDTSGSFVGESWSTSIMEVKKFYYVKASTETIRSKYSDSQDAYKPGRKSRRYESNKFINRKRK
ncbi:MAG: DUF1565 domain-containing protein [Candidatus Cloacimonetes bacterium]|nr:DUF1565 domain-containing protein [Candidatus Cloacimonadota bacterium]